jgi:hypothetical protein
MANDARSAEAQAIINDSDHRTESAMPKERPILFSAPMVRAILADRKTVTRRIVTVPWKGSTRALPYSPYWCDDDGKLVAIDEYGDEHPAERCLAGYGDPGERLWVRETFAPGVLGCEEQGGVAYRADHIDPRGDGPANPMRWKPSIFMRRHESRITLEVVSSRIEKLHAMTSADAFAEGIESYEGVRSAEEGMGWDPVDHFSKLWDEINGKRAPWADNPWVWRVEFRRLTQEGARHVA